VGGGSAWSRHEKIKSYVKDARAGDWDGWQDTKVAGRKFAPKCQFGACCVLDSWGPWRGKGYTRQQGRGLTLWAWGTQQLLPGQFCNPKPEPRSLAGNRSGSGIAFQKRKYTRAWDSRAGVAGLGVWRTPGPGWYPSQGPFSPTHPRDCTKARQDTKAIRLQPSLWIISTSAARSGLGSLGCLGPVVGQALRLHLLQPLSHFSVVSVHLLAESSLPGGVKELKVRGQEKLLLQLPKGWAESNQERATNLCTCTVPLCSPYTLRGYCTENAGDVGYI
jgi:hypothetical protein